MWEKIKNFLATYKALIITALGLLIIGGCLIGFFVLTTSKFATLISLAGILCYWFLLSYLNRVEVERNALSEKIEILSKNYERFERMDEYITLVTKHFDELTKEKEV